MISALKRLRQRWRELHLRVESLEKHQRETEHILDLLASDGTFKPDAGVGMNGQCGRKAIVHELFQHIAFSAAVETGTYMGQTTGYLATTFQVPVYSSEVIPRYYHVARRLLRDLPDVHLYCQDARAFLDDVSREVTGHAGALFFYLDAHWYEDLPLAEEVRLIASRWTDFVILIDDFQVPGDPGYGFDCYGERDLNLDLLAPALQASGVHVFFPAIPSSQESGRKRGSVLLASPPLVAAVRKCVSLRAFDERHDETISFK